LPLSFNDYKRGDLGKQTFNLGLKSGVRLPEDFPNSLLDFRAQRRDKLRIPALFSRLGDYT